VNHGSNVLWELLPWQQVIHWGLWEHWEFISQLINSEETLLDLLLI